jgi:DNA-binding MarR family transcriptional regulator
MPALRPSPLGLDTDLLHMLHRALVLLEQQQQVALTADPQTPSALSRLAERDQITAAHFHVMRHLPPEGARLTHLATRSAISKQAMSNAVRQCTDWGLVSQENDPLDQRASRVVFTPLGWTWRQAFVRAACAVEEAFAERVGKEVATVTALGLETWVAESGG